MKGTKRMKTISGIAELLVKAEGVTGVRKIEAAHIDYCEFLDGLSDQTIFDFCKRSGVTIAKWW